MIRESFAAEVPSVALRLGPLTAKITDDDFFEFCQLNRGWRIERTSNGEVIAMPPVGGSSGNVAFNLGGAFWAWAESDGSGVGFSPSTGFILPNGAERSPDLAWVVRSRWDALTPEQQERFPPLCPDFVAEIRSRTDSLADLQAKMVEYLDNGARLGWLIDPRERTVYVYRPGVPVERIENPATVSGDPVLPGCVLPIERLWGKKT